MWLVTGHPCLSFDTLNDATNEKQENYPMTCYLVAGTQAEKIRDNGIVVMKLTNLTKNKEQSMSNCHSYNELLEPLRLGYSHRREERRRRRRRR